jgi:hypothetical protein
MYRLTICDTSCILIYCYGDICPFLAKCLVRSCVILNPKLPAAVMNFFLEIGHIGYQSRILCWFQKREFVLVTKKCPQKVRVKKPFSNFAKSHFFRFLILTFFWGGHIVTKVSLHFWNQLKILDFFKPNMTFFKEKIFTSQKSHSNFPTQEPKKDRNTTNKEKFLFLNNLIYLLPIQNYKKHRYFRKFCHVFTLCVLSCRLGLSVRTVSPGIEPGYIVFPSHKNNV